MIERSHTVGAGLSYKRIGMFPSVCDPFDGSVIRPLQQRAAGLLLWAQQLGDIDRLLHGRRRSTAFSSKCGQCHVFS